ncbi:hypothetical protein DFS34DRAFT_202687 [Phlyctochytrium arcticum]|nr:hypothetical protein DFS34DRAFT_202687 [Phlyctochytrium arcticum]
MHVSIFLHRSFLLDIFCFYILAPFAQYCYIVLVLPNPRPMGKDLGKHCSVVQGQRVPAPLGRPLQMPYSDWWCLKVPQTPQTHAAAADGHFGAAPLQILFPLPRHFSGSAKLQDCTSRSPWIWRGKQNVWETRLFVTPPEFTDKLVRIKCRRRPGDSQTVDAR